MGVGIEVHPLPQTQYHSPDLNLIPVLKPDTTLGSHLDFGVHLSISMLSIPPVMVRLLVLSQFLKCIYTVILKREIDTQDQVLFHVPLMKKGGLAPLYVRDHTVYPDVFPEALEAQDPSSAV